jgi:Phosphotransferase enzyme family
VKAVGEATVVVWHEPADRVLVDRAGALPVRAFAQAWPPMDSTLTDAAGHGTILLEPLDYTTAVLAATRPAEGRWVPADAVRGQLGVVDAWLDRRTEKPKQPWFRPEWFAETDAWLDRLVTRTGPTRQVKQWGIAAVLRTPTTTGAVYTKAVLPELGREPAVTRFLAERAGPPFARLITIDGLRWLAEDFGGLPPEPDAVRRMAAIQLATIDVSRVLAELGCPSLNLVPPIVPADLREPLLACAERLAAYDLPATVLHRDLHPGNVVRRPDGILVHDWSFASIGPPLLDLGSWLWDASDDAARLSIEAYFDAWSPVVDPVVLRNAWADAKPLSAVAELAKFVELTDLVGPAGAFAFDPVVCGWEQRLRRCLADPDLPAWGDLTNWPATS